MTCELQPGDVVDVLAYTHVPSLYPSRTSEVPASSGWVVTKVVTPERDSLAYVLVARYNECEADLDVTGHEARHLQLVTKGPGTYTEGVTLPLSRRQRELKAYEELKAALHKALDERGTHEDWCNPATWAVAFQINNDSRLLERVLQLRRADKTINLRRLEKLVGYSAVEPWMQEMPLHVPEPFTHWLKNNYDASNPKFRLNVNWAEIEQDLRSKP